MPPPERDRDLDRDPALVGLVALRVEQLDHGLLAERHAAHGRPRRLGLHRSRAGAPAVAVALNSATLMPIPRRSPCWRPGARPSVQAVLARPLASVADVVGVTLPPPTPMTQATATDGTALPPASRTSTTIGCGSSVLTGPVWSSPETIVTPDAAPAVAVCTKVTGEPASPSTRRAGALRAGRAAQRARRPTSCRPRRSWWSPALTLPPPSTVQVTVDPRDRVAERVGDLDHQRVGQRAVRPARSGPAPLTALMPLAFSGSAVSVKATVAVGGATGAERRTSPV